MKPRTNICDFLFKPRSNSWNFALTGVPNICLRCHYFIVATTKQQNFVQTRVSFLIAYNAGKPDIPCIWRWNGTTKLLHTHKHSEIKYIRNVRFIILSFLYNKIEPQHCICGYSYFNYVINRTKIYTTVFDWFLLWLCFIFYFKNILLFYSLLQTNICRFDQQAEVDIEESSFRQQNLWFEIMSV